MKSPITYPSHICPICKKPKARPNNHAACSKVLQVLQAQRAKEVK